MADLKEMRIVLLGKTGNGKSSCGNTILGNSTKEKFVINSSPNSMTSECGVLMGLRAGKQTQIKIIDTPGFFDTNMSEGELLPEILKCITTCSPGPHAFIIVLKVERYTQQEMANVAKITTSFGERAFKYSAVLFTHGDQLDHDQTIEQWLEQNQELKELVEKCGGGCHVIDNKRWNQEHEYRSNRVQVEKLMNTIEEMVRQNGHYTNEMLQAMEKGIQALLPMSMTREEAFVLFIKELLVKYAGKEIGTLVGAFLGNQAAIFEVLSWYNVGASSTTITR